MKVLADDSRLRASPSTVGPHMMWGGRGRGWAALLCGCVCAILCRTKVAAQEEFTSIEREHRLPGWHGER
eukprot:6162429-Pyramimonas_sp.AAC.2